MTEESTPQDPSFAHSPADLPDIENLADSDDAAVIEARAKLLKASATLAKAKTPLVDKLILRGVIPIALAIVGPWALLKFDASQQEQKKQGEVIVKLEKLLEDERKEQAARKIGQEAWRARMKKIEKDRAEELHAMSTMVCQLDDTLKYALIQMAVAKALAENTDREAAVEDVTGQMAFPNLEEGTLRKMAGDSYDRLSKRK